MNAFKSRSESSVARFAARVAVLTAFVLVVAFALTLPGLAIASNGSLVQKPGSKGCISDSGASPCASGVAIGVPSDTAMSPDGKNVYAASRTNDAVLVFDRDPATGELTQKAGIQGCVSETGAGPCADGVALVNPRSVVVSSDGKEIYVASQSGIAIFDRNTTTGVLAQKPGTSGCISAGITTCAKVRGIALDSPTSIALSPDGSDAYVSGQNGVTSFDRDTATGELEQKPGTAGCIREASPDGMCSEGAVAVEGSSSIVVSPDGANLYLAFDSRGYLGEAPSGAIGILDRDAETGELSQSSGSDACIASGLGFGGCAVGRGLDRTVEVAISPDGANVYAGSRGTYIYPAGQSPGALTTFDRDSETGDLTQKTGDEGCISTRNTRFAADGCAEGVSLGAVTSISVSRDGTSAYAAAGGGVAILDRNRKSGALTQKAGLGGCLSETGAGPCTDGTAIGETTSIFVSPDNRNAYVTSYDGVAIFDREIENQPPIARAGDDKTVGPGAAVHLDGTNTSDFEGDPISYSWSQVSGPSVTLTGNGTATPSFTAPASAATVAVELEACDAEPLCDTDLVAVAVDASPPETTITQGPSGLVNNADPSFGFTSEAGASFECRLDGPGAANGSFGSCTNPKTYSNLGDGSYTFLVRAIDPVGNVDPTPATRSLTVDTSPPETTITQGPSGTTNNADPSFSFSAEAGATFECRIDSDSFSPCSSAHSVDDLNDGPHTFQVRATDQAGNIDPTPATRSFTVDTTPPETNVISGPSGQVGNTAPTFGFSSESGASFECRLDGPGAAIAGFGACLSPKGYSDLDDGTYLFQVRATDTAGNTDPTPATRAFTVDTSPPETTINSGPSGKTNETDPSFGFGSESGTTFECRLDGPGAVTGSFGPCVSPKTLANLVDGVYAFQVRATDQAGNTDPTPATRSFVVDTVAPETTITSGPSGPTNNTRPSFAFSSETGSSFECRVDSEPFADCNSPYETSDLADGPHTFDVRATDEAGNTDLSPATRPFTVDTAAPETTINSGPTGQINDTDPSFDFSSEPGSSFECRLDGPGNTTASFDACSSPRNYFDLADGTYTFRVRAADLAGNADATPASRSFTVETAPPDTKIVSGPSDPTNDATPTFALSSTEAGSFACQVDNGTWFACQSPYTSFALADGLHQFQARATDATGNTDPSPASQSFTVDTRAPKTTIIRAPGRKIKTKGHAVTISVAFSAEEDGATFECALDRDRPKPCASPFKTKAKSKANRGKEHTISVEATDLAGNQGRPATVSFRVIRKR